MLENNSISCPNSQFFSSEEVNIILQLANVCQLLAFTSGVTQARMRVYRPKFFSLLLVLLY